MKTVNLVSTFIIVLLVAGLGYFFLQNKKLSATKEIAATQTGSPTPQASSEAEINRSPTPGFTLAQTQNAIKTNTNLKDHSGMAQYLTTPTVSVLLYASECCQPLTPDETIEQLKYIDEGIIFNFDQNTEIVKNLKSKNPQLANTYIGISKDKEFLIAYTIDSDNQISQIQMSVSWKLYNL